MRLRIFLIPLIILVVLIYFVTRLLSFLTIFFEHTGIAITQAEIEAAHNASTPDPRLQVIPKHIHQVFHDWKNTSMPQDWEEVRKGCIDLNPDWEYTLWTEEKSREFIKNKYNRFLKTYDGYQHPVQRVDTIRYFALRHYGGIYLDLDNGCLKNLDPLLYYPAWTTDGGRGALSNNILGASPQHPFWILMTESLIPYNWNYFFPYVTISYASGQWYETAVWDNYHNALPKANEADPAQEKRLYRIMMDDRPGTDPWIFFTQMRGGTWVNWDNRMFLWIGDHLILEAFMLLGLVALVWWAGMRCMRTQKRSRKTKEGYSRARQEDDDF